MNTQVPAPRLSRTPAMPNMKVPEPEMGENSIEILQELGYTSEVIHSLMKNGTIRHSSSKAKL